MGEGLGITHRCHYRRSRTRSHALDLHQPRGGFMLPGHLGELAVMARNPPIQVSQARLHLAHHGPRQRRQGVILGTEHAGQLSA
jgi:hypothetical protein